MADPALALQAALVARLRAQIPALASRVYDRAPESVAFPHLEIGDIQTLDDSAGCVDAMEVFLTLHVWSRAVGAVEARGLASAVRTAATGWLPDLTAAGFRCVDFEHRDSRMLSDPDGVTSHAVITLRALVDAL